MPNYRPTKAIQMSNTLLADAIRDVYVLQKHLILWLFHCITLLHIGEKLRVAANARS